MHQGCSSPVHLLSRPHHITRLPVRIGVRRRPQGEVPMRCPAMKPQIPLPRDLVWGECKAPEARGLYRLSGQNERTSPHAVVVLRPPRRPRAEGGAEQALLAFAGLLRVGHGNALFWPLTKHRVQWAWRRPLDGGAGLGRARANPRHSLLRPFLRPWTARLLISRGVRKRRRSRKFAIGRNWGPNP